MICKSPKEDFNDSYYHFAKDLQDYPEAGAYVVWSRRGPGKTYSFLRYCVDNGIFFIYMKRRVFQKQLVDYMFHNQLLVIV